MKEHFSLFDRKEIEFNDGKRFNDFLKREMISSLAFENDKNPWRIRGINPRMIPGYSKFSIRSRRINSKVSASNASDGARGRVEFRPRIAEKRRVLCEEEKIRYGTRGATRLKRDSLHSPLKPRASPLSLRKWQTRENGFNFRVPAPSRGRRFYSLSSRRVTTTQSASPLDQSNSRHSATRVLSRSLFSTLIERLFTAHKMKWISAPEPESLPLSSSPLSFPFQSLLAPSTLLLLLSRSFSFHAREPLRFPFLNAVRAIFLHAARSYARSNGMSCFFNIFNIFLSVELFNSNNFETGTIKFQYFCLRRIDTIINVIPIVINLIKANEATFPSLTIFQ